MKQAHMQQIEEHTKCCPEGCKCHNGGIDSFCKAEDVGLETFVECLEEEAFNCASSVSFADSYYCKCLLRVYIAKKLKKITSLNGLSKWGCVPKWKPGTSGARLALCTQNEKA